MAGPEKTPPGSIRAEDIVAHFSVTETKDGKVAVQFPGNSAGLPDIVKTLALMGSGINTLAQVVQQIMPQETPRVIPVASIPKEFLTRGKL